LDEFSRLMNRGQAVTVSQVGDLLEMDGKRRGLLDYERVGTRFLDRPKAFGDLVGTDLENLQTYI